MKLLSSPATWPGRLAVVLLLLGLTATIAGASSKEMKFEAVLVWGTNDDSSPDPNHKAVEPDVEKKLKKLPFKWKNYFEVNRKDFSVEKDGSKKIELSKDCEIKVRNLGNGNVELTLYGKGKSVGTIKQALPKGELLVTGGNAENLTAWFVVLRQVE
jgi:hypothetical protein